MRIIFAEMGQLRVLVFVLCMTMMGLRPQWVSAQQQAGSIQLLVPPTKPIVTPPNNLYQQAGKILKAEKPPKSFAISEDDFKDYVRGILGNACRGICYGAEIDSLPIYRDPSLKKKVPHDSIFRFEFVGFEKNYCTANQLQIILNPDKSKKGDLRNAVFGLAYYSVAKDTAVPAWQYFVKGGDFLLQIEEPLLLDSLAAFCAGHSPKDTFLVNDSVIGAFVHHIVAGINLAWYDGVVNSKTVAMANQGLGYRYSIKEVENRCSISETVSVQIDPNDPYSTKDSTVTYPYNPQYVYSGICVEFKKDGSIGRLGPIIVQWDYSIKPEANYLFMLKAADALSLLSENQKDWLAKLILYKMKQLTW